MTQISRQQYADLYGPTVGDKIRLGDTDLYVEIEKDLRTAMATNCNTVAARRCATAWDRTTS